MGLFLEAELCSQVFAQVTTDNIVGKVYCSTVCTLVFANKVVYVFVCKKSQI